MSKNKEASKAVKGKGWGRASFVERLEWHRREYSIKERQGGWAVDMERAGSEAFCCLWLYTHYVTLCHRGTCLYCPE